jgi:hypothetical protein
LEPAANATMKKTEFIVTRKDSPRNAEIVQDGKIVAQLEGGKDLYSILNTTDGTTYFFHPSVDGKIQPFSMTVGKNSGSQEIVLKIVAHLFAYQRNLYVIGGIPEGKSPRDIGQTKFICRLVNFPYSDVDQIDPHVREKLGRYRGAEVGELSGLGRRGHKVVLGEELKEIGLPLAVACYLLYSAG